MLTKLLYEALPGVCHAAITWVTGWVIVKHFDEESGEVLAYKWTRWADYLKACKPNGRAT